MASTIKVTNISTPDGTGNITVDRPLSGSGASLTNLPVMGLYMNTLLWDTSTTGTQAITGVGFEPTHIFFVGNQANVTGSMSFGWYGPSAFKYHISDYHTVSADTWTAGTTYAQQDNQSGAGAATLEVTAVGADGFTFTKATSGSPSGTWRVNYIAWKVT